MSQPEMQPEGPPREHGAGKQGAGKQGAGKQGAGKQGAGKQGDLLGRPFPHGDWGEPAERLDELYRWVEEGALRVADWYLADRVWKRRAARVLRVGAAVGAVVGAALSLLDLNGVFGGGAGGGCLSLLLAAACVGCDRFFGLTSGWMRDLATAQAVQRRLEGLQFDWASESVREVLGPTEGTATEAVERCLVVLRRFCEDVSELVRTETAGWMVDFGSGSAPLFTQSLVAQGSRPDGGSPTSRLTLPPSPTRPNMPRQRPPEPPR